MRTWWPTFAPLVARLPGRRRSDGGSGARPGPGLGLQPDGGNSGFGQLLVSGLAGLLWTAVSPTLAFGYLALFAWLAIGGVGAALRQGGDT